MNTVELTKGELTKIILEEVRRLNEQAPPNPAAVNAARDYFAKLKDPEIVTAYTLVSTATGEN
tara:strand:+ start:459 stop:647 length:189 start_codon:yes stop_codon:yes gene_type:complete